MSNVVEAVGSVLRGGEVNVGRTERMVSTAGGGVLALLGLRRGGVPGALLAAAGAALAHRGITGHCAVYRAMGRDTALPEPVLHDAAPSRSSDGIYGEASIAVQRPADELYAFWRDVRTAPRYQSRIVSVDVLDERRSRWVAEGPRGRSLAWTSVVTEDVPGRRIAWESLPGSDLPNRGSVEFAPGARAGETLVRATMEFHPPAGVVGQAIATALHQSPHDILRADLRAFKALMEGGAA
ncbi:MAG TPA: SRPBCC family protein [Longimicrobium sp.]|uniref:SRPBCC family protein n=1 Tax=Longimicrobium sp. TaxID=2029185 RepID=UPI002EDAD8F2